MSYDPTIGRFIQRDPIGYDDGMNQYAFVGGNPIGYVDPSGLLAIDSTNPDIKSAVAKLENSKLGQGLLENIKRLESCAKKEVRVILSPVENLASRTIPGTDEIQVWMNPYDQVGVFPNGNPSHNIVTGPNPDDFRIGTELDALLYHELQHALFFLIQARGEKQCIKVGESRESEKGQKEEEERITRLENEYRREKGYPERYGHGATEEQNQKIGEELARGTRGALISGKPDFRGESDRRMRERGRRRGAGMPR